MKYAIVTGASPSSIGFIAAKKLASPEFGYKVILACRSDEKGRAAEDLIRSAHPSSQVAYVHLDLSSFASIRKFVEDIHALDGGAIPDANRPDSSLSILVNNAGVGWGKDTPFRETADGLEEIVGVNHFGTFLLTQLLLEDLERAEGGARVTIVSSSLHEKNEYMAKKTTADRDEAIEIDPVKKKLLLPSFPEGLVPSRENYDGMKAYQVSKLCNLWYAYELQRRLDGGEAGKSSVRVNALSPGFIPTTGLNRQAGTLGIFFLRFVLDPFRYFGMGVTRSPEDGAETIVLASTSEAAGKGGQYFELPRGATEIAAIASSAESMDDAKARALWDLSLKTCQLEA